MTSILQSTLDFGTLTYAKAVVNGFTMPMAGKTGTTQNWSDIWTVGYSPYYTTAVWFGFDQPGNSLGADQTGATAAGPVWAHVMKDIHAGLAPREFPRPSDGLIDMSITARSGLLPPAGYRGRVIKEVFLAGTEPHRFDDLEDFEQERDTIATERIHKTLLPQELSLEGATLGQNGLSIDKSALPGLSIDPSLLDSKPTPPEKKSTKLNPLLD
jgi:penicillin-binding protein 1A